MSPQGPPLLLPQWLHYQYMSRNQKVGRFSHGGVLPWFTPNNMINLQMFKPIPVCRL